MQTRVARAYGGRAARLATERTVTLSAEVDAPLDLEVLCPALGCLLRYDWEDGYLIFQVAVGNVDPDIVAAEYGVSRLKLSELLRDAVDALAVALLIWSDHLSA